MRFAPLMSERFFLTFLRTPEGNKFGATTATWRVGLVVPTVDVFFHEE